jgi:acyl carrier protein
MSSSESRTPEAVLGQILVAASEAFGRPVAATDNFFDLEGDSLHALDLITRLSERFGVDVDIEALLQADDFAGFARAVVASLSEQTQSGAMP